MRYGARARGETPRDADDACTRSGFRHHVAPSGVARRRIMRQSIASRAPARPTDAACVAKMNAVPLRELTVPIPVDTAEDMKLSVTTEVDLEGPPVRRYVTWLDVVASDDGRVCGTARIALVHVGEIADAAGEIWPALHGTRLDPVADTYFAQGWYKDEFADGAGIDLFYVDDVTVAADHRSKNLDLAIVRRLCDTLGSGSQLAVVGYADAETASRWARLGFEISTPGRPSGLMHLKLGQRHAHVVDATGSGDYEVLSTNDGGGLRSVAN